MGERDHITFRAGTGLHDRLDRLSKRYGMKRSQLIRLLLKNAADQVETDGLDTFVDHDTPIDEQTSR